MKQQIVICLTALAILAAVVLTGHAQQNTTFRLVQKIPLPTGFNHFDHFGVDAKGGRLFATFEDHNTVEVFDLNTGKILHSIPGFTVPHNVLYLPDLNEVVITDGAGTVNFLRGDSLEKIATVKLTINADFVVYDPRTQLFYVTNGGHAGKMTYAQVSIIDKNAKHVDDIRIEASHIEFLSAERSGPRIFLSLTDKNAIGVIDRDKRKMVTMWPLPGDSEYNIPNALDQDHARLFTVSRKPTPKLIVFDTASGKSVAVLPAVGESDDIAYDAKRKRVYVSGAEGFVSVFQQDDPDHYTPLAKIPTGKGAATSTFVPELDRLYVGVKQGEKSAELHVYEVVP